MCFTRRVNLPAVVYTVRSKRVFNRGEEKRNGRESQLVYNAQQIQRPPQVCGGGPAKRICWETRVTVTVITSKRRRRRRKSSISFYREKREYGRVQQRAARRGGCPSHVHARARATDCEKAKNQLTNGHCVSFVCYYYRVWV